MEDETVKLIRSTTRVSQQLSRQQNREIVNDGNRRFSFMNMGPGGVEDIAEKLKTKTSVSSLQLEFLKNGLLTDPDHLETVLSTPGALRRLVKELTGHNIRKQSAALGCLCNLALTDEKGCKAITKQAGPYLVTTLDSYCKDLAVSSIWTLGNLGGSGAAACELLTSQGALTKLSHLLRHGDEEMHSAAVYALDHFAHQLKDDLSSQHLKKILQGLARNITMWSAQAIFTLSCHKDFLEHIPEDIHLKVLDWIPYAMASHFSHCKNHYGMKFCCKLVYLFRILANMDPAKIYAAVLDKFVEPSFSDTYHELFQDLAIGNSLLWLLGNLYNHNSDHVFFQGLLSEKCIT